MFCTLFFIRSVCGRHGVTSVMHFRKSDDFSYTKSYCLYTCLKKRASGGYIITSRILFMKKISVEGSRKLEQFHSQSKCFLIRVWVYIPQTELALWVSSAIKGWWRSAGRARLGGSAIFFLSQTFCKHRRLLPYFLRQRGGSSTTRAAATATCLSPMSIKRLPSSFFRSVLKIIKIPLKNVLRSLTFFNGRKTS